MYQGCSTFSAFLHNFVLAKLGTTRIRVSINTFQLEVLPLSCFVVAGGRVWRGSGGRSRGSGCQC